MFSTLFSTLFAQISEAKPTPYSGEEGSLFRVEMIRNGLFGKHDFACQTVCRDTILSLSKGLLRRNLASMTVEMRDR